MPDFSTKQRENLAEKGQAMPSGAFPIRNRADLKRAIQAFGRAKNPEKTKAWIIHRARQLDAMDLIPEKWIEEKKITHVWERDMTVEADVQEFLAHYGKKGMKWGERKALAKGQLAKDLNKKPGDPVARAKASAQYKQNIASAKKENRIEKGEKLVGEGSVKSAGWKVAGLGVAKQVLLSVGATGLGALAGDNQAVRLGIGVVAQLAAYGSLVSDINKGINISAYKNQESYRKNR
jgi:hypothetical protein